MDILEKIVEGKKEAVRLAASRLPEHLLRDAARSGRDRRPFVEALRHPGPAGVNIIAEVKRASPSKGDIRPDLDPGSYARMYAEGGAAAVSVLTDTPHFKGSPEDLKAARAAAPLPVLRKDFIISTYQIYESVVMGADAVLLIVRILTPNQLRDYLDLARSLSLDCLVEVHTEADIECARRAGAELVGINNRNLRSFRTDIGTAAQLVKFLGPEQIPVAESGIGSREDVLSLVRSGIHNFLIGESLVRAEDPVGRLRELLETEKRE